MKRNLKLTNLALLAFAGTIIYAGPLALADEPASARPATENSLASPNAFDQRSFKDDSRRTDVIHESAGADLKTEGNLQASSSSMNFTKASDLVGMSVRNAQNEKVGTIKDVVVDLHNGRAPIAILASGGFFGVGDRMIAVPVSSFSRGGDKTLTLNIDSAKLKGAPSIDKSHWPTLDQSWCGQVYQYYGVEQSHPATSSIHSSTVEVTEPAGMAISTTTGDSEVLADPDAEADRILRMFQRGKKQAEILERQLAAGQTPQSENVTVTPLFRSHTEMSAIEMSAPGATIHESAAAGGAVHGLSSSGDYVRVSELMGMPIRDSRNEKIGELKDVVIDFPAGVVTYAIVGSGGTLGLGEKYFALPPSLLTRTTDSHYFVVNSDKDLHSMPTFERSNWPDFNSQSYATQVYSFFGMTPSWSGSSAAIQGSVSEPSGASSTLNRDATRPEHEVNSPAAAADASRDSKDSNNKARELNHDQDAARPESGRNDSAATADPSRDSKETNNKAREVNENRGSALQDPAGADRSEAHPGAKDSTRTQGQDAAATPKDQGRLNDPAQKADSGVVNEPAGAQRPAAKDSSGQQLQQGSLLNDAAGAQRPVPSDSLLTTNKTSSLPGQDAQGSNTQSGKPSDTDRQADPNKTN